VQRAVSSTRFWPGAARGSLSGRVSRLLVAAALLAGGCQGVAPSGAPSGSSSPTRAPAQATAAPASPRASTVAVPSEAVTDPRPLFGTLPAAKLDATRAAALQQVLDATVAAGAPDVIAAVITPAGTWAGAAGTGGPDGRNATVHDEFAIGSVGKTFLDALVIRLAEQGRIDLDAPIAAYLGDLAFDTNGATVRQALGQRSGIPDIGAEVPNAIAADPAHRWTLEDTLAVLPEPSGPPGPYASALSNSVMLSLAVEHVTGGSFADALRAEVLDPVAAARILVQGYGVPTPKPWALPTEAHLGRFKLADLGAGGAISCIASATASHGVGGLAGDAPSLAAWAWHLLAGDIVGEASLAAMLPGADGHGLGLDRLVAPLDHAIGMPGAKTGYGAVLAILPAEQMVAVVLVNDEEFRIDGYIVDLIDAATTR
jgi:D-alanyl-D-alanine carboxypeptidase